MATITSIQSRLSKLESKFDRQRSKLREIEMIERLLSMTQHWPDADFEAMAERLRAGDVAAVIQMVTP